MRSSDCANSKVSISSLVTVVLVCLPACLAYEPPSAPSPQPFTITGTAIATNGGDPLAGASVAVAATTTTTGSDGSFSLAGTTAPPFRLTITGSGLVARSVTVTARASVDAIVERNGFDLAYYRKLLRDGTVKPYNLEPLHRWTRDPRIYLRTVDNTGAPVDNGMLDMAEAVIRDGVPRWTSGQLHVASLERGHDSRENVEGFVTVKWSAVPASGVCGQTPVGDERGGVLELFIRGANCRCAGGPYAVGAAVVRHEVGHLIGLWHTDELDDLMSSASITQCEKMPTARELLHAAILYRRPVGNVDPDSDP